MQLKTGRKAWKISKTEISQTVRKPISQCENFANCSQTSFALRNPNPQYTVALRKFPFAKFRIAKIRNEFANQIRNANFAKPISQCQMQFRNAKIFAIPNSQCENFAMRKFAMRKFRKVKFAMPNAISQCENTVHLSQPMRNFALRNSQPLADRSIKIPKGTIEDVLIQVDRFYYPVDFVVLETEPVAVGANHVPIILGRPFLATSNAIINCWNGVMQLTFGNMTLELNIFHLSKRHIHSEEDDCEKVYIKDAILEEQANEQQVEDVLTPELSECLGEQQEPQCMSIEHGYWRRKIEILPLLTGDEPKEPQQLELKPLLIELKYAFLEEKGQCPVVISSLLTTSQEHNLLQLLKRNKQALGWKIYDLKGINPSICTHHIYLEEESKAVRQPQRRLNPHLQEVVRIEVLKLLQAGIIYPISDSTWVSPTQVVPKKSGVTTVRNEKGEELSTRLTTDWRVCIDNRRLNEVTRKDHFPLPFIDQLLERVSGHPFYCFLDGYSRYF